MFGVWESGSLGRSGKQLFIPRNRFSMPRHRFSFPGTHLSCPGTLAKKEVLFVAKEMVEGLESAAAARCLMKAGAPQAAQKAAPQGILKSHLENR